MIRDDEDGEERSPVFAAMGVPEEVERGTIWFSLDRSTTQAEIDSVAERIGMALEST